MSPDASLRVGALIFPAMDQMDFTGPFEVLSQIPGCTFHLVWKDLAPLRDTRGLVLKPDTLLNEAPPSDVLLVPGGPGQEKLMDDEPVLSFLRDQARQARYTFSVCTGALICGAAGLLRGLRATTHWNSLHLLEYFGAMAVEARVVVDGKHVSTGGVTSGIDGALRLVQLLRGDQAAQVIQLAMQYAPEPPFQSGTPGTAPPEAAETCRAAFRRISEARLETARRVSRRLGLC
jgi:cyclohexyl-isocyanide hydratase